jgi:serine/threonine protein kinase
MVSAHLTAKLADFGESTETQAHKLNNEAGTLLYMAPEVLLSQSSTNSADVYSYG